MEEFSFELVKTVGVLSTNAKDWTREINVIRWNGKAPKYDVRDWSPDHLKMGKGISFTKDEVIVLRDLLNQLDLQ